MGQCLCKTKVIEVEDVIPELINEIPPEDVFTSETEVCK